MGNENVNSSFNLKKLNEYINSSTPYSKVNLTQEDLISIFNIADENDGSVDGIASFDNFMKLFASEYNIDVDDEQYQMLMENLAALDEYTEDISGYDLEQMFTENTYNFSYDNDGNITSRITYDSNGQKIAETSYTYNDNGSREVTTKKFENNVQVGLAYQLINENGIVDNEYESVISNGKEISRQGTYYNEYGAVESHYKYEYTNAANGKHTSAVLTTWKKDNASDKRTFEIEYEADGVTEKSRIENKYRGNTLVSRGEYDSSGRPIVITEYKSGEPSKITEYYTTGEGNQPSRITEYTSDGNIKVKTFDQQGNITEEYTSMISENTGHEYKRTGKVYENGQAVAYECQYTYDTKGNLTGSVRTEFDKDGKTPVKYIETTYTTGADNTRTETVVVKNANKDITEEYTSTFNSNNQETSRKGKVHSNGAVSSTYESNFTYDTNGNMTKIVRNDYNASGALLKSTTTDYTITDSAITETTVVKNAQGITTQEFKLVTDPETGRELTKSGKYFDNSGNLNTEYEFQYNYDASGKRTSSTLKKWNGSLHDNDGSSAAKPHVYNITYDDNGNESLRTETTIDEYGNKVVNEFDNIGRMTKSYKYNEDGSCTITEYEDGKVKNTTTDDTRKYDSSKTAAPVVDDDGNTIVAYFNSDGKKLKEKVTLPNNGGTYIINYCPVTGRELSRTGTYVNDQNQTVSYIYEHTYNSSGKKTTIYKEWGADADHTAYGNASEFEIKYNSSGEEESRSMKMKSPDGKEYKDIYDSQGRPREIRTYLGDGTYTITYYENGVEKETKRFTANGRLYVEPTPIDNSHRTQGSGFTSTSTSTSTSTTVSPQTTPEAPGPNVMTSAQLQGWKKNELSEIYYKFVMINGASTMIRYSNGRFYSNGQEITDQSIINQIMNPS